jgi:hypothetical protein
VQSIDENDEKEFLLDFSMILFHTYIEQQLEVFQDLQ